MRDHARAVIIGGGVGGASIAYHLTLLGWDDVVLVERDQLTSGSTFHSAGLVGQLRSSVTLTRMMMYGAELYRRLAAETGHDPGWHEVGSLRLASTPERAGGAGAPGRVGPDVRPAARAGLDRARRYERFHGLFDPTGVLGAVWLPTDGWLNPTDLTMALAAGARSRGAEIATMTRVTGIGVEERGGPRRVTHVDTDQGRIACEVVVNAGGMFAYEIGRLVGVNVPVVPMAHQYALTRPAETIPKDLPTMRDPDRLVYFREEVGGLVVGGYERDPEPWCVDGSIPSDFNNTLLPPDWDRFLPLTEAATTLVPCLADADVTQLINGPEAFTPDGEFILGESEVAGFFVAAGFCAHGIAGAGGNGQVMAEWIVGRRAAGGPVEDGHPPLRRPVPQPRLLTGPHVRGVQHLLRHRVPEPRASGRSSPAGAAGLHRHVGLGAELGEKSGWERVNWYWSNADPAHESPPAAGLGRRSTGPPPSSPSTWPAGRRRPCSTSRASPRSRSRARGRSPSSRGCAPTTWTSAPAPSPTRRCSTPGAGSSATSRSPAWPRTASSSSPARPSDATTCRGSAATSRPRGRAARRSRCATSRRRWPASASGALGRATCSPTSCADDLGFRYMSARRLTVGDVPCLALRVTYVGELGWELYPPSEYGLRLWDLLIEAGRDHGLVPGRYRAIDSLRLEKGYRVWGSDITSETDPYSAGLGFAVRLDKDDFVGRDAVSRWRLAVGPSAWPASCWTTPGSVALGNEPVKDDGRVVGRVSSGGLGYSLGLSIAYAWVPAERAQAGTRLTVEVFGETVGAEVRAEPLYDPSGERIRA